MPFGDFNSDGHVDGRDYALFKIATGNSDSGGSSDSSGGSGGGCGCLTVIFVILILFGIIKLIAG